MSKLRSAAGAAVMMGLVVALATGCASPSVGQAGGAAGAGVGAGAGGAVAVADGAAVLDPQHDDVLMPLGRFQLTNAQYTTLRAASDLLTQTCLAVAGFDETYPSRLDYPSESITHYSFGVWNSAQATEYGFAPPPAPPQVVAFADHLRQAPEAEQAALTHCTEDPEAANLNDAMDSTSIASRADEQSWAAAESDPRAAAVFALRRDCMSARGYSAGDDLSVAGADSLSHDQQVAAALADVDCKTQTGFVQKFADIAAAYQLDFIAQNTPQLTAEKAELDALLSRAQQILAPKQ